MNVQDPEALIQCPYEKVHMIRRKRMPYHLQKCRRNYQGQAFKVCPFNARHEVPEPEYRHHLLHCPNKCMVEKDMIHIKRLQEDAAYREKYDGGLNRSSSPNHSSVATVGSCVGSGASDRLADNLSRAFDRGVTLTARDVPSPKPEYDWFEDGSHSQNYHPQGYSPNQSPPERRRQPLQERRLPNDVETSDYGSDGLEGSSTPGRPESKSASSSSFQPQTEPVTLQMIKAFGRGSDERLLDERQVGCSTAENSNENVDDAAIFGARFPPSLGRGTTIMMTPATVGSRASAAAMKSIDGEWRNAPTAVLTATSRDMTREIYEDDSGNYEDAPSDHQAYPDYHFQDSSDDHREDVLSQRHYMEQLQQRNHQQWEEEEQRQEQIREQQRRDIEQEREDQFRQEQYQQYRQQQHNEQQHVTYRENSPSLMSRDADAKSAEDREIGYANFPSFQRGLTPRYNSTFCADRPLSKQAQIQLAQQQQMGEGEYQNYGRSVRRGKRGKNFGRGAGKRFQFNQQQTQQQQQHQQQNDDWNEGDGQNRVALGRGISLGRGCGYDN